MPACPNCTKVNTEGADYCVLCGVDLSGDGVGSTQPGLGAMSRENLADLDTIEGPAISVQKIELAGENSIAADSSADATAVSPAASTLERAGPPVESMDTVIVPPLSRREASRKSRPTSLESTQILLEKGRAVAGRAPKWMFLIAAAIIFIGLFSVRVQLGAVFGLWGGATGLAGTWFRIGDEAEGTAVEVSSVGDGYEARATLVAEHLKKFGFTEDDLMWREISRLDENHFRGKVLYKQTELPSGKVISTFYREHDFFLEPPDLLRTRSLASGSEVLGTEQVWKKLKD